MATQHGGTRPLGALGRMGVVAAHARRACSYLIANSLGHRARSLEEPPTTSMATIIDEPPPVDDALPLPSRYRRHRRRTRWSFAGAEPPPDRRSTPRDVITGPPPTSPTDAGSRRPAAPSSQPHHGRRAPGSRVIRCRSRRIRLAISARATRARSTSRSTCMPNGRVGDARIVKSSGFERLTSRRWMRRSATGA